MGGHLKTAGPGPDNVKLDYMQTNSKNVFHTFVFNKTFPCPAETMQQVTEKSKLLKQTDKDGRDTYVLFRDVQRYILQRVG